MKTNTNINCPAGEAILWGRALIFNGLLVVALPWLASENKTFVASFVCVGSLMLLAGVALCASFQGASISEIKNQSQT